MRVAAFSLTGLRLTEPALYQEDFIKAAKELQVELITLPAYTSMVLWSATSDNSKLETFKEGVAAFTERLESWNNMFLKLHSKLAQELQVYLAAGTTLERAETGFYVSSYCFDPMGELCAVQRQTHLSAEERAMGFTRGSELELFELRGLKAGILVGLDARHPETGRIFALRGADILIHPGALELTQNTDEQQLAGIWSQVQQNQCWAVEAQYHGRLWGRNYSASSAVLGPCEATGDLSGFLVRAEKGAAVAAAELREELRARAVKGFPVLGQLNPPVYGNCLYQEEGSACL